jgi:hypothetical protein
VLPGLNSVIVPLASVVVVVVVVSETWPHANGATNANAMLNTILFIFSPLLVELRHSFLPSFPSKLVQGTCRFTPIRIGYVVWMLGNAFCCTWF